jgi:hypothetical protein
MIREKITKAMKKGGSWKNGRFIKGNYFKKLN